MGEHTNGRNPMDTSISIHGPATVQTGPSKGPATWLDINTGDSELTVYAPVTILSTEKAQWLRDFAAAILTAIDQPGTYITIQES